MRHFDSRYQPAAKGAPKESVALDYRGTVTTSMAFVYRGDILFPSDPRRTVGGTRPVMMAIDVHLAIPTIYNELENPIDTIQVILFSRRPESNFCCTRINRFWRVIKSN
jgi:hypothetical protein